MSGRHLRGALLLVLLTAWPSWAQPDAERLKSAKALFFDRKYAEARQAWQTILAGARGAQADGAAYWVARSSENLGEDERALKEYGAFLARRPTDRALAEEARTSRVGLAARLYKAGRTQHLPVLRYYPPEEFDEIKRYALSLGYPHVESGPLVRSSYHAEEQVPLRP